LLCGVGRLKSKTLFLEDTLGRINTARVLSNLLAVTLSTLILQERRDGRLKRIEKMKAKAIETTPQVEAKPALF